MDKSQLIILDLMSTVEFAALKHRDQRRKDQHGTPYINHPIGVAMNVINIGKVYDVATIQAALLHDTVEDTATTKQELVDKFGEHVANIVMDVTDDKSLSKVERKRLQIEHASHISAEAKIVKMSDKLYNLTDMVSNAPPSWSLEIIQGYFVWGKQVCHQLRNVNKGLEEALDKLFQSKFNYQGKEYPVVPCQNQQEELEFLEKYYSLLK
ncbi:guanosine-3',5'-bis-diphosphate- 3'-diphosphatase [Heterostelium album PN500]|uniref:Guanosine-3',5'-bis(diphosphate) 3'-pyrophosphohydrolase MESH1 n=1 Tax=Heterostelium pallidum (strain ATCC 26659 / Pp 5 / PN500) TaxID=670386 RepID=D3B2C1_HETP5|nr:guanosine-3',5'-bis-diphosphate- 3'-diphosphatase [Heterostelium album PN500]EFA84496.1 guanosine-3',5'-bis-diphosphate- 3'-diphosphatase [Heterostelium album PN500]|eukprot:XP_020436610.1 guanosine-3',5'-bis-diphosphate- 3'-diphosphatase [Heterostelium album PN500]